MTSSIFCTPFKNFFPCFDSGPLSEVPSEPTPDSSATPQFKKRFCADWRIIPALVTLVACILGVVFSIIWNHPYLSIPFAIGGLCDLYLLYVSYHYRHLQSLEKSSLQLKQEADNYKQHNEVHSKKIEELTGQVTVLQNQLTDLHSTNESLKEVKDDLNKQLSHMTTKNQELSTTVEACNQALEQQAALVEQLSELEKLMNLDRTKIAEGFKGFSTDMESYKKTVTDNEKTASDLKQHLESTGQSLKNIFARMQELLQDASLKATLDLNEAAANAKTELKEVTKQLDDMKKLKDELDHSVNKLKEDLKEVASHGTQMKNATFTMEQTTEVMKQVLALKTNSGANLKEEEDDDDKNSQ